VTRYVFFSRVAPALPVQPRNRHLFTLLGLTLGLLAGCGSVDLRTTAEDRLGSAAYRRGETHSYKRYPGPLRPSTEVAVVRLERVYSLDFNGRPVSRHDWSEVHLPPGVHLIRWRRAPAATMTIEPGGLAAGGLERVVLAPGKTYVLRSAHVANPAAGGHETFVWMEDAADGEVVAGTRNP